MAKIHISAKRKPLFRLWSWIDEQQNRYEDHPIDSALEGVGGDGEAQAGGSHSIESVASHGGIRRVDSGTRRPSLFRRVGSSRRS